MKWIMEGARGAVNTRDALDGGADGGLAFGRAKTIDELGLRKKGRAHDMRNLLQVISSAVHLMERESERGHSAEVHRLAGCALETVERAANLSSDVPERAVTSGVIDAASTI